MKTPEEIKMGLVYCRGMACGTIKLNCPYEGVRNCSDVVLSDSFEYIQQLEAQVPRWISVEERLPEDSGKYIVCTTKGSVYCTRFKAHSRGGNFQTDINTHITHWMPMPEPPKEDDHA